MTTGHRRILATSFVFVLCACLADSASAQSRALQPGYGFCYSHQPDERRLATNFYHSGIFSFDPSTDGDAQAWNAAVEMELRSGGRAPNPGPAPWVARFNEFIAQRYANSRRDGGACTVGYRTLAEARQKLDEIIQSEQRSIDAIPAGQARGKVVDTGWKYSPNTNAAPVASASQPAAAAPVAAAPVAQPQTPHVVCHDTGDTYFSAVFDGTKGDRSAWTLGFMQFLQEKYRFTARTSVCDVLRSPGEAQTFLKQRIDTARSFKREVIETGWTYTAAVHAPAPAPVAPTTPAPARGASPSPPPPPVASAAANPSSRASTPPARGAGAPAPLVKQTPVAFCWGQLADRTPTAYVGAPFDAPERQIPAWTAAYKEFLTTKYKFVGVIHCGSFKSSVEVQREHDRISRVSKIIETGWKYR